MTSGEYYVDLFSRYGADPVWVPVTETDPRSASDQSNVDTIMGCDGVFLGGGEPWRLARTLRLTSGDQQVDSPVLTAIKTKLAGGFLGGTSAGIMALSDAVVISGLSVVSAVRVRFILLNKAATVGKLSPTAPVLATATPRTSLTTP